MLFSTVTTHIWSDKNPHARQEVRFQRRFSINVWTGIVNDRLVGPSVLLNKLNAAQYLEFKECVGRATRCGSAAR